MPPAVTAAADGSVDRDAGFLRGPVSASPRCGRKGRFPAICPAHLAV